MSAFKAGFLLMNNDETLFENLLIIKNSQIPFLAFLSRTHVFLIRVYSDAVLHYYTRAGNRRIVSSETPQSHLPGPL
jgi:hypothetical protein